MTLFSPKDIEHLGRVGFVRHFVTVAVAGAALGVVALLGIAILTRVIVF